MFNIGEGGLFQSNHEKELFDWLESLKVQL
jgi:hypothetical protein